jgi:hypothetical protein
MMMSIENGEYYKLSDVSAEIWRLIETPQAVHDVYKQLSEVYNVDTKTCELETVAFIQNLHNLEMVVLHEKL